MQRGRRRGGACEGHHTSSHAVVQRGRHRALAHNNDTAPTTHYADPAPAPPAGVTAIMSVMLSPFKRMRPAQQHGVRDGGHKKQGSETPQLHSTTTHKTTTHHANRLPVVHKHPTTLSVVHGLHAQRQSPQALQQGERGGRTHQCSVGSSSCCLPPPSRPAPGSCTRRSPGMAHVHKHNTRTRSDGVGHVGWHATDGGLPRVFVDATDGADNPPPPSLNSSHFQRHPRPAGLTAPMQSMTTHASTLQAG